MKNSIKVFALVLALLMLLAVGACGNVGEGGEGTDPVTEADASLNVFGAGTQYVLIRSENATKPQIAEFLRLRKAIQAKNGEEIVIKDDWVKDESEINTYEILFGDTNRPESRELKELLECKGFLIAVRNGKLVVYANSDKGYTNAVSFLEEEFLDKDILTVEEGYFYTAAETTPISGVTINGVNLNDFTVVAKNRTQFNQPLYTADRFFSKYCGLVLEQALISENPEGHKIVIGGTKADGSAYGQFEIGIYYKDGDLHLGCANEASAQQVLYTFFAKYLDTSGKVEITLPEDGSTVYALDNPENWDEANPKILTIQDRICRSCYKLESLLEYDMSKGIYFTYQGPKGYMGTIAESRTTTNADKNRTTNCVIVGNWVMKDAGFYTSGIYNHTYDGSFGWTTGGGSTTFFNEYMTVIDVRSQGKSINSLTKEGAVLPGDIIGFKDHNQTVLPNGYAFDGGRSSSNMYEAETGGRFKHWVGPQPYPSMTVGFIARDKDAD